MSYPSEPAVYAKGAGRSEWSGCRRGLAELVYEEHDALLGLRGKAEKALLKEAKGHREWHLLKTCPGLGPLRMAELLPVVVTRYRFPNRSKFWSYCGLGVVMRTSSDWVRSRSGQWVKAPVQRTRGLNRTFNHTLKRIFKGAATTVIGERRTGRSTGTMSGYWRAGTKPNLAKLTAAAECRWGHALAGLGRTREATPLLEVAPPRSRRPRGPGATASPASGPRSSTCAASMRHPSAGPRSPPGSASCRRSRRATGRKR